MGEKKHFYTFGLLALVLGVAILVPAPAHSDLGSHVIPSDPASLEDPTATARCGPASATPVPDGKPIIVRIPPADPFTVGGIPASSWRNPPSTDPTWQQSYRDLIWTKPLAERAAKDHQQKSLNALIDQVVAFHRQNPDPKNTRYGWDEATALRRLESENCLYALTHAARLIPGLTADAAVLLGDRYYGPPRFRVHNHGLMANIRLIQAATLLGKPDWKAVAIKRMKAEAPKAFSKLGTAFEQSASYQLHNANVWQQAADLLAATPGSEAEAATISRTVIAAKRVYGWMTEPDGNIVQVGDAYGAGKPMDLGAANRVLKDDETGWIIGRWSWTDPATSYYTIRYGPPRYAHGHQDRAGGVTWTTEGVRVLVGPGAFSYETTSGYAQYQKSPQGQNVAIPAGTTAGTGPSTASAVIRDSYHRYAVRDTVYGVPHVRGVTVYRDAPPHIVVSDSFAPSLAKPPQASKVTSWQQHWHLDPQWTLVSSASTRLTFSHPSGRRLTITTTGRLSSVEKGVARPPAGWHFPSWGVRVAANEVVIRNHGTACTTTFTVT
jgi:hypothetical protein